MTILLLREPATLQQVADVLEELGVYVKLAVDIRRGVAAGGGELHADCEQVLLDDGSQQIHVWGADWDPASQTVKFEAPINIRLRQKNPAMQILDPAIRSKVEEVAQHLLKSVP